MEVTGYDSWVKYYKFDELDWHYVYLTSLHWSLTQFTPGGMHVQPQNWIERAYTIMMLVAGMIIFSSIVSNITMATNTLKNITARYDKAIVTLRRFFRQHDISNDLLVRVTKYADSTLKPKMARIAQHEVELILLLPKSMRMDVILELRDQYLEVHPFYKVLKAHSRTSMQKLCASALSEATWPRGADLFFPGEAAESMYFVTAGDLGYSLSVIFEKVERLYADSCFCEAVLWTPWVFQGRMISIAESEILALDSARFREIMLQHPADMWLTKRYATEFVDGMNERASSSYDDEEEHQLSDLWGGHEYIVKEHLHVWKLRSQRSSCSDADDLERHLHSY